jgi:hypothetical protein
MAMAYATVMEFDVDLDTHRKIIEAVGDGAVSGLILHAAGPSEAGIRSIDVWETKEDSEQFFVERLTPAMAALDIPGGPPVTFEDFDMPVILRG